MIHYRVLLDHLEALMDAPFRHWIELERLIGASGKNRTESHRRKILREKKMRRTIVGVTDDSIV